jgi:hypothetical protein
MFSLAKTPRPQRFFLAGLAYMDVGQGREKGYGSFASWRESLLKFGSFVKMLTTQRIIMKHFQVPGNKAI